MGQVYVEDTAMADWKTRMQTINANCISSIEKIDTNINNLNSSFQGSYASMYEESFGGFTTSVKASHESLKDFSEFLDTVVNVMKNQ